MQDKNQDLNKKSQEYAKLFVELYGKRFEGLDYSEQSLKVVDKILETDFKNREPLDPKGTMATFGCYVAEVIIKNLGGKWMQTERGQVLVLPTAKGNQIEVISPIIRIGKYFKDKAETMSWFYEMTKKTVKSN